MVSECSHVGQQRVPFACACACKSASMHLHTRRTWFWSVKRWPAMRWGVKRGQALVLTGALAVNDVLRVCVEVQIGDCHVDVLGHGARRAEATYVCAYAPAHSPYAVHVKVSNNGLRQLCLCQHGMHALCIRICQCAPRGSVHISISTHSFFDVHTWVCVRAPLHTGTSRPLLLKSPSTSTCSSGRFCMRGGQSAEAASQLTQGEGEGNYHEREM